MSGCQLNKYYTKEIRMSLQDAIESNKIKQERKQQIGYLDICINRDQFEMTILEMSECGVSNSIIWKLNDLYCLEVRLMTKWQKQINKDCIFNVNFSKSKNGKIEIFIDRQFKDDLHCFVLVLHKRKEYEKMTHFVVNGEHIPKVIGTEMEQIKLLQSEFNDERNKYKEQIEALKEENERLKQSERYWRNQCFANQECNKQNEEQIEALKRENRRLTKSENFWRDQRFAEIKESHFEMIESTKMNQQSPFIFEETMSRYPSFSDFDNDFSASAFDSFSSA